MVAWKKTKIGEICKLEYGKPLPDEYRDDNGLYPVFGANGEKARTNKFYFDKPSIIVGRKGSAGELNLTAAKFWPLDVTYFVTFDEQKYDLKFLYFLLKCVNIPKLSKGIKPGINRNDVYNIEIAVPPLAVQQTIVAKLDAAFASIDIAIAAAEKNAENAKQLFQSYLSDVFEKGGEGWVDVKFADIAEIKGGKRLPKGYELTSTKTAHPYLRVTDFGLDGTIDESSLRYISEEIFAQIKRYTINCNDLYVSIAGTIGRTGIIPPHLNGANLTENACKLVFKENVSNYFVYWFTNTSSFFKQAVEQTRTAAQPKLALSRLEQIELKLPSLSEQNQLNDEFEAVSYKASGVQEAYRRKNSLLLELKQSLLQQAFSGQLVDA